VSYYTKALGKFLESRKTSKNNFARLFLQDVYRFLKWGAFTGSDGK
jgi:hypothetical protein